MKGKTKDYKKVKIEEEINILILSFYILFMFKGCSSPVKTNVIQSSFDIEDAKKNGVFVTEYFPSEKKIDLKNQSFIIEQVWIERQWCYVNQNRDIDIRNHKRGFIKLDNDDNILDVNFTLDDKRCGGIMGRKLFFNLPVLKDTLLFKFYRENDTISVSMYRLWNVN